MPYQVSRNGQTYGPYTLEDLQRYVASGNIASTDLAKSEEMPDWLPVSQILNIPAPSAIAAQPYMPPANYPASAIPYPDPPNVPWVLDLLLWFLTCSFFNKVYILVQAAWLQKIHPTSKALMLYIIATVIAVINIFASFSMVAVIMAHPGVMPHRNPLSSLIGLVVHWHSHRRPIRHAKRLGRALQHPGADRPAPGSRHDILLRRHLLPVPLQPHQRNEASHALPRRFCSMIAGLTAAASRRTRDRGCS